MRYMDDDEAARLNAQPWQLALLKANPEYCAWGPHEDYMIVKGEGWNSSKTYGTWAEFGPWNLDDLNECVNFYFSVGRASEDCKHCGGDGYAPEAQRIANAFYAHDGIGQRWCDRITEDEAQALIDAGRAKPGETAEFINARQNVCGGGFHMHDAINRHILIEARCKRLGHVTTCPHCEGHGYTYTAPAAHVSLTLWWLHPRKGCSRGIEITRLEQADLPAVQAFLKAAAQRNAERFAGVGLIA